jgi:hypothetical protein
MEIASCGRGSESALRMDLFRLSACLRMAVRFRCGAARRQAIRRHECRRGTRGRVRYKGSRGGLVLGAAELVAYVRTVLISVWPVSSFLRRWLTCMSMERMAWTILNGRGAVYGISEIGLVERRCPTWSGSRRSLPAGAARSRRYWWIFFVCPHAYAWRFDDRPYVDTNVDAARVDACATRGREVD